MTNQVLTKHELVSKFFKLGDFKFNVNWNEDLLKNTSYRLNRISNPNPYSFTVFDTTSRSCYNAGPLSLISANGDDPFRIREAISSKNPESRFCEKLSYEGFEIFIFVKEQKLVSIVVNPHQFLDAFDINTIIKLVDQSKLEGRYLQIGYSSMSSADPETKSRKEMGWCGYEYGQKEDRIIDLVRRYKNFDSNYAISCFYSCLDNIYEQADPEKLFDLLPSLMVLFNYGSLPIGFNYLVNFNEYRTANFKEISELNRFCLKTKTYITYKHGGLFKGDPKKNYKSANESYKNFKRESTKLSNQLLIQPKVENIDGDEVLEAKRSLYHKKTDLIEKFARACLESKNKSDFKPFSPREDNLSKNIFNIRFDKNEDNVLEMNFFKLLSDKTIIFNTVSTKELEDTTGELETVFFDKRLYLMGIGINREKFLSFLEAEYANKLGSDRKELGLYAVSLAFQFNNYIQSLQKYIFEMNRKLNRPWHRKVKKSALNKYKFDLKNITLYYSTALAHSDVSLTFGNYYFDDEEKQYKPINFDIGEKNIFLKEHKSLLQAQKNK